MNKKEILRTIKFTLFSISAGVIQILSYTLLLEVIGLPPTFSHLISLVLSVLYNFTINRKFTFKAANNVPIAMLKVGLFYLVFTPLSTWLIGVLVNANWDAFLAEALMLILNFVLEFLYCTFVVYRNAIDSAEKKES